MRFKLFAGIVEQDDCQQTPFDQCDENCLLLLADDLSAPFRSASHRLRRAWMAGVSITLEREHASRVREVCDELDGCDGRVDELIGQASLAANATRWIRRSRDASRRDALNRFDVFCDQRWHVSWVRDPRCVLLAGAVSIDKPFCNVENGLAVSALGTSQAESGCEGFEVCRRSGDLRRNFVVAARRTRTAMTG